MRTLRLPRPLLILAATALSACAPHAAPEPAAAVAPHARTAVSYVAPDDIDLRAVLPDPCPDGSPLARAEVELVLAFQADAPAAARSRALAEDSMTVWIFADVLGPGFNPGAKPRTAALLAQAEADARAVSAQAKRLWSRNRPSQQDARVQPLMEIPPNASYPSGHATRATVWARILALLAPDRADAIAARARLVSSDRVVAGVHFPSDVTAGIALGNTIADRMLESPAFRSDLESARTEWKH